MGLGSFVVHKLPMEEPEDARESDNLELHPTSVGGGNQYRGVEPEPPHNTTNIHGQDIHADQHRLDGSRQADERDQISTVYQPTGAPGAPELSVVTRLLSAVDNVEECAHVLAQIRGRSFKIDEKAIQTCVYYGSSKARAVMALSQWKNEQSLINELIRTGLFIVGTDNVARASLADEVDVSNLIKADEPTGIERSEMFLELSPGHERGGQGSQIGAAHILGALEQPSCSASSIPFRCSYQAPSLPQANEEAAARPS